MILFLSFEYPVKCACRELVDILQRVEIDVCRLDVRMPEARGNCLDVTAVGEQQCRGCVPHSVQFQMPDSMPLQELRELFGRCLRIHDRTVLLGEHIPEILP